MIPGQGGAGDPVTLSSGDAAAHEIVNARDGASNHRHVHLEHPEPGTYLYQSGTQPSIQVPMGLYGALAVVDGTVGQAYPGISYDADAVLLFSEIDPFRTSVWPTPG